MTEPARNTIVGITTLLGLVGLAWLIFIFGDAPKWIEKSYPVHITLDDASGLDSGSPIRFDGITIGEIDEIQHKPGGGTLLLCRIKQRFDLPANAVVRSEGSVLGGSAMLKFSTQRPNADPVAKVGKPFVFPGIAGSFTSQLAIVAARFAKLSDKIEALATEYILVGASVRALVEERSVEEVDAGRVEANLSTVIARADIRMKELAETIGSINKLVGDEQLHKDVKAAAAGARLLTENANTVVDKAGVAIDDVRKLTAEAEKKLERLTTQYVKVADDLSDSLAELKGLAKDVRTGKGTFSKLIKDPALYDSLKDAADKLQDVLDEAELLLKKWKAEGLPLKL